MPRFHLFPHCFERFPFDMPAVHLIHAHAIPLPVPEMGKQNRQNVKGSANGNHSPIECSFRFSLRQINSHCPRSAPSGPPVCFCCFIHIVAPHPPISTPTTPSPPFSSFHITNNCDRDLLFIKKSILRIDPLSLTAPIESCDFVLCDAINDYCSHVSGGLSD
jgi:hypothetical protein